MKQFSCDDAKQINMVDYLAFLNHYPQRIQSDDYWYLSPLRNEKTASFKVNWQKNLWYDHAMGKGGDLIDFGTLYHNCSISDLLQRLSNYNGRPGLAFHSPAAPRNISGATSPPAGEKKEVNDSSIVITNIRPLTSFLLTDYVEQRCIPVEIAIKNCKEVDFLLYGKKYTVIGFQNNAGGFELRSEYFKGSSSPKSITFIDNNQEQVAVFEGFFNYLAFQALSQNEVQPQPNFLILNSLSFFEKSRDLMERHREIHLLLDRDTAGIYYVKKALTWNDRKYIDRSDFYMDHKDLNDLLIHNNPVPNQCMRRGREI